MPDGGRGEVYTVYLTMYYLVILLCTAMSNGYEMMARVNYIYYPLMFFLFNFGIGMGWQITIML